MTTTCADCGKTIETAYLQVHRDVHKGESTTMATAHCFVCGRWNDPTGGPDAHSGGCPNTGKRYDGTPAHEDTLEHCACGMPRCPWCARDTRCNDGTPATADDGCRECGDMVERPDGLCHPCAFRLEAFTDDRPCVCCGERPCVCDGRTACCAN